MVILILLIVIIGILLMSPTKEGFWERPEFKTERDDILECLNNECVKNKKNNCIQMCNSGVLDSETQSPGYKKHCSYQCKKIGNQILSSLSFQQSIFNRVPIDGEYIPAFK